MDKVIESFKSVTERREILERLIRIGLVLLVLSLALNIALITRVNKIEDMINGRLMVDELQSLRSLTQQTTDRINQAMSTIETEQRWITPVEIAVIKQEANNTVVRLSWIIKDYPGSAPVTFHYRKQGVKEFTSRQAISVGAGRFEVELTDNMKTEPDWKIQTTYLVGKNGDSKTSLVNEEARAIEGQQNMEYYISVKDGTHLKSSEMDSLNLEKISWGMYAPLIAEVQVDREREKYWVLLTQPNTEPKQVKLSQAFLEAYRGDERLSQNKLTQDEGKPDESVRIFNGEWNYHDLSFDRVFLTVEYENGKQFKKEITGRP